VLPCPYAYREKYDVRNPVPPETGRVEVTITQDRNSYTGNGFTLFYKPGNRPPTEYYTISKDSFTEAPSPTGDFAKRTWKIPVKPEETDDVYAKVGNWEFILEADDRNLAFADGAIVLSNLGLATPAPRHALSVKAFRGP
jgi:hypothetical protein